MSAAQEKRNAAQEKRDVVSARIGANIEREHVLLWLRARGKRNKSLIYFTLADEIEQGAHIPTRSAEFGNIGADGVQS